MGHFLGLNNLLDDGVDYDFYASDRLASDTAPLGLAGTLSFSIAGATTNVAYAAGDSLSDIATAITGALGGANITASVVREADGYRLQISDTDGDNFYLSDSGTLTLHQPAARCARHRRPLEVRQDIQSDPDLLARGELSDAAGPRGRRHRHQRRQRRHCRRPGQLFTSDVGFAAAGGLLGGELTLEGYGAAIIAGNAAGLANAAKSDLELGESFQLALENQAASLSQVNLDEELANIVVLQNTYAASARITSVVSELLDDLLNAVR